MSEESDSEKNSIFLDIIHLSDFETPVNADNENKVEEERNKYIKDIGIRFEKILKQLPHVLSVDLKDNSNFDKNTGLEYYEDENVCRFSANIKCERKDRNILRDILRNVTNNYALKNSWFALNDNSLNVLSDSVNNTYLNTNQSEPLIKTNEKFNINGFNFGTLIDLTKFVSHYNSNKASHEIKDIYADFNHQRKRIELTFELLNGLTSMRYKLEYNYSSFDSINVKLEDNFLKLYIHLNDPPILFVSKNDYMRGGIGCGYNLSMRLSGLSLRNGRDSDLRVKEFDGITAETIGKCNVVVIEIPIGRVQHIITVGFIDAQNPFPIINKLKKITRIPVYFSNITEYDCIKSGTSFQSKNLSLPFAINYAFNSIFSHTFQVLDELLLKSENSTFISLIEELFEINSKALEHTLYKISVLSASSNIFQTLKALQFIFNKIKKKYNEKNIISTDRDVRDIRRCILTPTRLLLLPPLPIQKSRFDSISDPDYVLRLKVCDDDLSSIGFALKRSPDLRLRTDIMKSVVKIPIVKGIKICQRVYHFLGSSSSQLRDHGMVLYAKDSTGRTAESIREEVGDLTPVSRNVPKYVARLGLIFSQTITQIAISLDTKITLEKDIKGDIKPNISTQSNSDIDRYVFSDGIGKVSQDILDLVYQQIPYECAHKPSAIQIRFGGCKGMLVLNPSLKGKQIIFRESMKKFASNDRTLGILKTSAARPLYLSRPLITILDQMKVESKIFEHMLSQSLNILANSMVCKCSAIKLLQNSNGMCIPFQELNSCGIEFMTEPIFRQMIDCLIPFKVNELKTKARIKVPINSGRIAFGVLDETRSLEYGQIFAQLSEVNTDGVSVNKCFTIEGEVMVTKFPCLHPGDVRKFTAVNIPELNHIKDCIVFPAKGQRPHPDEMAGSDLDGDEYAIFWNSELIFKDINYPPMHFPNATAKTIDKNLNNEDVLEFYCNYILNNNMGVVANAHLAHSDLNEKGIFSNVCMSLANKYSIALDFPKTGIVEQLVRIEKPVFYPDFMDKLGDKYTYLSNKVLGKLYRQCRNFEIGIKNKTLLRIKASPNPKLILDGWEKYEVSALNAYTLYREKVYQLLNRFDIPSEAALLSGAFNKTNKHMTGGTEISDVYELVQSLAHKLFIELQNKFNSECEGNCDENNRIRASAWYLIPYKLQNSYEDNYFGFPFTISKQLCKIAVNPNFTIDETHECLNNISEKLDLFIITDRRDSYLFPNTIESNFSLAKHLLINWIENQDFLFFTRYYRKVIPRAGETMFDIESKIEIRLNDMKTNALIVRKTLNTCGNIFMSFLNNLINDWLSFGSTDDKTTIFDIPLIKFDFCALLAINHFYKTKQISHIIDRKSNAEIADDVEIKKENFQLIVPENRNFNQINDFISHRKQLFCQRLQDISGVQELEIRDSSFNRKTLYCSGTVWSLQILKNLISHPKFFDQLFFFWMSSEIRRG